MIAKNIHFYSAYLRKGGASIASDSLFKKLDEYCDYITFTRSSFNKEGENKHNIYRILGKLTASVTYQSQFYRPFISKSFKKYNKNFSIVHAHWLNNIPLNSIPTCKSLIITCHDQWLVNYGWAWDPNSLNSPTKKIESSINNLSKLFFYYQKPFRYINDNYPLRKIITPSLWLKNYIIDKTDFPSKKVVVIKNIIDNTFFKYDQKVYSEFKKENNKIVVVASTAYWQEWRKGRDLLMKIFRKLIYHYKKNIIFKIIGKIEIDRDIKNQSILYGNLNNKRQLSKILNSSNCMVMPSRLENLTQTISEALFCGLPVVAFDVGGNREIISDEIFGYLVTYPQVNEFINPVIELAENDNESARRIRAINAKNKFSTSKILKQHIKLYENYL